jgi:nucleotide-binding universal stress UspA family protein
MNTSTKGAVVVGVTGPGRETAALRFAADCAARAGAEVILVHAYGRSLPPPPPSILMTESEAGDVAEWVAKGVGEEFDELTDGSVPFRTLAVVGRPARVLVDLSRDARLVVVQHREPGWLGRLFVGSTVNGVAASGGCPVVSVPQDWEPPAAGERPKEVLVGVHEGGAPREAVSAAMEWAAATDALVRVVHAWRLDPAYDDIVTARVAADWHAEQVRALESAIADLRADRPSVPVRVEVLHQWPIQVLVDGSATASLVVVGRHGGHWRGGPHLGSVARTVLREAQGPVMVVPLPAVTGESDDWDLDADEVSPQT